MALKRRHLEVGHKRTSKRLGKVHQRNSWTLNKTIVRYQSKPYFGMGTDIR